MPTPVDGLAREQAAAVVADGERERAGAVAGADRDLVPASVAQDAVLERILDERLQHEGRHARGRAARRARPS